MLQVLELEYFALLAYILYSHLSTLVEGFCPVGNQLGLVWRVVKHGIYGCQFGIHDIVQVLNILRILVLEGKLIAYCNIRCGVICFVRKFREEHGREILVLIYKGVSQLIEDVQEKVIVQVSEGISEPHFPEF